MRRAGFNEPDIAAALLSFNDRECDPPLNEQEVVAIAKSVARYPAGDRPPAPAPAAAEQRKRDWTPRPGPAWMQEDGEQTPFLIAGVLVCGGLVFISGEPKTGKTWIIYALILALANSMPFLGVFEVTESDEPHRVLLIGYEGSSAGAITRLSGLARGMGLDPQVAMSNVDVIWRRGGMLDDPEFIEHLKTIGDQYALIVIDTLAKAWTGDENSNTEASGLMRGVEPVMQLGSSLGLVHHTSKSSETTNARRAGQRMRGASALHGGLDSGLHLSRSEKTGRTTITFEQKDGAPAPAVTFTWPEHEIDGSEPVTLDVRLHDDLVDSESDLLRRVVDFITENPGETRNAIGNRVRGQRAAVLAALDLVLANGSIRVVPKAGATGLHGAQHFPSSPPPDLPVPVPETFPSVPNASGAEERSFVPTPIGGERGTAAHDPQAEHACRYANHSTTYWRKTPDSPLRCGVCHPPPDPSLTGNAAPDHPTTNEEAP